MFEKILIANRGEIACRVIRTARRMGIKTVAVYSDADRDALHTQVADEAVAIGPPPARESYLQIERIVQACRQTGAQAVHPGYGFLSENPLFAKALGESGIVFIGPGEHAVTSMGDKITSKRLAQAAGVSIVPGSTETIRDADHAVQIAQQVGYPVMLKASAGGGGKGMRIARNDMECRDGFQRAANEARSSFGDDRVFIERYVEQPRHIEIQILADRHGNVLYLGERECSLQRRHQKVIEEAPSPFLNESIRAAMGEQAVALARAVGYESAGTVEFIVSADRQFYFLEMNTRLQVEHPVTEYVTGLDLVEWMIRIAAGEPIPFRQEDVRLDGWAIEARVYAEDPARNFLPSIGRLIRYLPPRTTESIRVDTGVYEGGEVSMYYDPMIAKLITYGADRKQATTRMLDALNAFYIRGVSHNISFLSALLSHPRFAAGDLTTNLIGEEFPRGFDPAELVLHDPTVVTVAAVIHRRYRERSASITGQLPGYERRVESDWVVQRNGERVPVRIKPEGGGYRVEHSGLSVHVVSEWQFGQPLFRGTMDGVPICVQVERRNLRYRLSLHGAQVDLIVLSARAAELLGRMPVKRPPDFSNFLLSPMPGLLTQLLVKVGDEVQAGQNLVVVEAMKMENVLRAERDSKIVRIHAAVGETLAVDQAILEFQSH